MDEFISKVDKEKVIYSYNNRLMVDENKLKFICDGMNYEKINLYNSKNDSIEEYDSEKMFNTITTNIETINNNLSSGELVMLKDGSVVSRNEVNNVVRGGKNSVKVYWWGVMRYMSTKRATKYAHELQTIANRNFGLGAISGAAATFFGVMAIPAAVGGITGAYLSQVANDINYYNGKSNKGVKAKLYWILKHEISVQ